MKYSEKKQSSRVICHLNTIHKYYFHILCIHILFLFVQHNFYYTGTQGKLLLGNMNQTKFSAVFEKICFWIKFSLLNGN